MDKEGLIRLRDDVLGYIESASFSFDEERFQGLALRLWRWHVEALPAYRAFCARRLGSLDKVTQWQKIPALPVEAFKQAEFACPSLDGKPPARKFTTSGTTGAASGQAKRVGTSVCSEDALRVMDVAIRVNAGRMLFPDGVRPRILVVVPSPEMAPHMIIAYGMAVITRAYGAEGSGFLINDKGIDAEGLWAGIEAAQKAGQPVCLIGSSFGFVHLCDSLAEKGVKEVPLPEGSRVMDAGGYKGRSRELTPAEFRSMISAVFRVPESSIVNLLGMTELASQLYDSVLADRVRGMESPRRKVCPPWVRTRIVSPDDPTIDVRPGERGLLAHYDLANWSRPVGILSDDLGVAIEDGFHVLGRVKTSEARGCSIKVDELLTGAK